METDRVVSNLFILWDVRYGLNVDIIVLLTVQKCSGNYKSDKVDIWFIKNY